jgi:hypothetical protein
MRRVLVPALITLAITVLRLVGELQDWSPALFNNSAGGGGALVGIAWLVIVFGAWFAVQLVREGNGPASAGRSLGVYVGALAATIATGIALSMVLPKGIAGLAAFTIGALVGIYIASRTWPELFRTLLAYAFAARIPVVIVMLLAMLGSWGTHYDALPPDPEAVAALTPMGPLGRWFLIGVVPQFGIWIAFTVIVGGIVASLTALVVRPRSVPARAI